MNGSVDGGILLDGRRVDGADAVISVKDEGLLRGDGVFEVLRIYGGRLFALDDHLERLGRSAQGLRQALELEAIRADALLLAEEAGGRDAVLRIVATRGGRRILSLEPVPAFPAAVSLATVEYLPNVLTDGLKTLSYAANALGGRVAKERGADMALFVRPDGRILEGTNFAVFLVLGDGGFVTPPLDQGILDSITRRRLLDLVPIEERRVHRDQIAGATEAFVASTLREVLPVSRIDDVELPAAPGPRTADAAARFKAHVEAELDLTPVPT